MPICPSCGENTPPNTRFCEACGAELPAVSEAGPAPSTATGSCVSCGAAASSIAADGYCGQCGLKQPPPRDHRRNGLRAVAAVTDRGLRPHVNRETGAV